MRILWIVNSMPKEASRLLQKKENPFGSWIETSSQMLANQQHIGLTLAFPTQINTITITKSEHITYIAFPVKFRKLDYFEIAKEILSNSTYDVIHIHGTELIHSYVFFKVAKKFELTTVLSIQGLMSEIANVYLSEIPSYVTTRYRLRDFVKRNRLIDQLEQIKNASSREIEMIQQADYIIGRTKFDYQVITKINPEVSYFKVMESMRSSFYENTWDINKINKHHLFLSQAVLPLKGLHILLEAISLLKNEFPDIKLVVGGENIFTPKSCMERFKQPNYGNYITKIIKDNKLDSHITFCGVMNEEEVVRKLLSTHIVISSSTMENSSNAIAEAMLCGVPVVASDVGGSSDFVVHGKTGLLYPFYDKIKLASLIRQLFLNDILCQTISRNASVLAKNLFNKEQNVLDLVKAYHQILKK